MIVRPLFPPTIDSSMLSTFRSCPKKFQRTYLNHWKPKEESVHLHAGGAFAKGLEMARRAFWEQGIPADEAVGIGVEALMRAYGDFECPPESAKSLPRMLGALEFYFSNYPLDTDSAKPHDFGNGRFGIEFKFAEPLDILHPTLRQPLIFTGRSDMICDFAGGLFIEDDKTASSLGASWSKQWDMRGQFSGYTWAAQRAGLPVQGTLVRGVSILKTKYDTQQCVTYRPPFMIDMWLEQTYRDIKRMMWMWEEGYWDYALDGACVEYGGCNMARLCTSKDESTWLPMYFEQRVWDPLAGKEVELEAWLKEWQS